MNTVEPLILSLSHESAERTGTCREFTFDACDGSIGRSDDCDWTLAADGVSRVHAVVRHLNGLYFVEDRSTNGMLMNGAPMRKGDPAALKHGDRLQVDTFEIEVSLRGREKTGWDDLTRVGTPTLAAESSQGDHLPLSTRDALPSGAFGTSDVSNEAEDYENLIPGATHSVMPGASLDPLALFDAPSSYLDAPWTSDSPSPAWNHTPVVSDRFHPPAPESARANASLLPDDWNATHIEAQRQPAIPPEVEREVERGIEPHHPQTDTQPATQSVMQPHTDAHAELQSAGTSETEPAIPAAALMAVAVAVPVPPAVPASVPASVTVPASSSAPVASPAPRHDDLMPLLIVAVDAMMDVLRARAELKNSFRLPATLIQRSENNPLKFAPTAQDAVAKLLAASDGGFLSGRAALDDAADDIRNHQMAMLAGVRSAFDAMLTQFDPARIEEQTEGNARRLSLGGRPRHWERYKSQFEAFTRNPDECFRRLFGDEFARAYEAQLSQLKSRRD